MKDDKKQLNKLSPEMEALAALFSREFEARERAINLHNSNPNRKTHITPFGNEVPFKMKDGKSIGYGAFNCKETFLGLGKCQFDLDQDPHCDRCILCGQTLSRRVLPKG